MGDSGQVVFIPGFMQRGEAWAEVAAAVGESYPSTCLDHSAATARGRIAEIEASAAPGAALVGYSLGGRIALHAALAAGRGRFRALVLVSASAGIDSPGERLSRRIADEELARWIERHPIAAIVERWERQPVFASQSPQLVGAQRPGRLTHTPAALASLLRSAGQGQMEPVWGRVANLAVPLLAIAGERDERYARAAERLAATAPAACSALVAGAGHAVQLERPAQVARLVLEFLAGR